MTDMRSDVTMKHWNGISFRLVVAGGRIAYKTRPVIWISECNFLCVSSVYTKWRAAGDRKRGVLPRMRNEKKNSGISVVLID